MRDRIVISQVSMPAMSQLSSTWGAWGHVGTGEMHEFGTQKGLDLHLENFRSFNVSIFFFRIPTWSNHPSSIDT